MASLFVIQGRDQGTRFELDGDSLAFPLGREAGNRIQLHDTEVSRQHAEIRRSGNQFVVCDLGSSNGTFVNNERVEERELDQRRSTADRPHRDALHRPERSAVVEPRLADRHRFRPIARRPIADRPLDQSTRREPDFLVAARHRGRPMAGPGPQQPAGDVSHGTGGQPHARYRPVARPHHAVDLRMGRGRSRLHHAASIRRPGSS